MDLVPEEAIGVAARAWRVVRVGMAYGDPRLPTRFWAKVYPEPNTGCWLWAAATTGEGYGVIRCSEQRRQVMAHRWVFAAGAGGWPPKQLPVDHLCRVRACVNPDHLELVTHQVNVLRGERAGPQQRTCIDGHVMDEQNTYYSWGRNRLGERVRRRRCHACKTAAQRKWARANQNEKYRRKQLGLLQPQTPEQRSEQGAPGLSGSPCVAWGRRPEVTDCECIYVQAEHPNCERFNATRLVDLSPGSPQAQTAAMCGWCANDWLARHPQMVVVDVRSAAGGRR